MLAWDIEVLRRLRHSVERRIEKRLRRPVSSSAPEGEPLHPRKQLHEPSTLGQKAADWLAARMGSWMFLRVQNLIIAAWIGWNSPLLGVPRHLWFDPPPWIGLNLFMSWEAANSAPVLQMSANRQATKDRDRDDLEAQEVEIMLGEIRLLRTINQQQLEILHGQNDVLALLREERAAKRG